MKSCEATHIARVLASVHFLTPCYGLLLLYYVEVFLKHGSWSNVNLHYARLVAVSTRGDNMMINTQGPEAEGFFVVRLSCCIAVESFAAENCVNRTQLGRNRFCLNFSCQLLYDKHLHFKDIILICILGNMGIFFPFCHY